MTRNTIKTVKINKIINECKGVKTLFFNLKEVDLKDYIPPKPGQFVMIWVPGVDEVPMSISGYDDKGNWSITVKNVGECTNAMNNLKIGDYIGVRGPLGNYFKFPPEKSKNIFILGGGIGMAPLKCLISELYKNKHRGIIIEGAKGRSDLIFIDYFKILDRDYSEVFYCTNDGSYGLKGTVSDIFKEFLKNRPKNELSNTLAYTCGPEKMMYKIFQICENYNIKLQASLERIMRCGCGLCGLCAIDPLGSLVCKEGPIFNSLDLRNMSDFGKYERDFTGKKIPIK